MNQLCETMSATMRSCVPGLYGHTGRKCDKIEQIFQNYIFVEKEFMPPPIDMKESERLFKEIKYLHQMYKDPNSTNLAELKDFEPFRQEMEKTLEEALDVLGNLPADHKSQEKEANSPSTKAKHKKLETKPGKNLAKSEKIEAKVPTYLDRVTKFIVRNVKKTRPGIPCAFKLPSGRIFEGISYDWVLAKNIENNFNTISEKKPRNFTCSVGGRTIYVRSSLKRKGRGGGCGISQCPSIKTIKIDDKKILKFLPKPAN